MDRAAGAAEWPLIGREDELRLLRSLRRTTPPTSALLLGPFGVGKSRLAREALAEAAREGFAVLSVRGSTGLRDIPLGPFRAALGTPVSPDLVELTASVTQGLQSMRHAAGIVVHADEAQYLDESSIGLLHQLVVSGVIVALVSIRSGATPVDALVDLWKDGFAERIELGTLSRRQTAELLAAALGGPVRESSADHIWHVTEGNALYVREVVLSSLETGALRPVDGEWRWRGQWAKGSRLQELVATRLGRLDPDELSAMELLAIAGTLPFGILAGITGAHPVEALEARGLVGTERSRRRVEVAIGHPLHAEVLRGQMPELRQRAARRMLVDALVATGARRASDRVRIACWSLESGLDVDPMTLALGSTASLFGLGHAIAARLQEVFPKSAAAAPPPVPQDPELALRLAEAAYQRTGSLTDGVDLASALGWTGDFERAERVLAELADRAEAFDDRLRIAFNLAWTQFWGRYDVPAASEVLLNVAEAAEPGGCDGNLLAEVYQGLAGIALNTGRLSETLPYAELAAKAAAVPLSHSIAAPAAAAALAYLGRCAEALTLIEEALAADAARHPLTTAALLFSRAGALGRLGRLEEARELLEWLRDVSLSSERLEGTATFGVLLGDVLLRQGRSASAGRVLRDSVGLLGEQDLLGYRPWALAGLARARARAGAFEAASAALEEARRAQPIGRHFDMAHHLAEIELHALAGHHGEAVAAARKAVRWARDRDMPIDEAHALDAWVRLEPERSVATRLGELAEGGENELLSAFAEHARAAVAADGEALLAVSERFAAMTAWRLAADSAAAAARLLEQSGHSRASTSAVRVALRFADRCEDGGAGAVSVPAGGARLTRREREIAVMAADGSSAKEIAARMFLSPRTVENHLQHAYTKLGVTDRSSLAEVLASS